jgi:hypothetical protein
VRPPWAVLSLTARLGCQPLPGRASPSPAARLAPPTCLSAPGLEASRLDGQPFWRAFVTAGPAAAEAEASARVAVAMGRAFELRAARLAADPDRCFDLLFT